jgi:hypothetical protein
MYEYAILKPVEVILGRGKRKNGEIETNQGYTVRTYGNTNAKKNLI